MSSSGGTNRDSLTDDSSARRPTKRAKHVRLRAKKKQRQAPFRLLTDDSTLLLIFEFIGPYHFRFIAGVSRRWRSLYTQFQRQTFIQLLQNAKEEETPPLIFTSITCTSSIAESLSRAKVFLSDTKKLTGPFESILMEENGSQEYREDVFDTQHPRSVSFLGNQVAVRYGQLDMLQLAIANGCTCDETTCWLAARNGHLEVLQWLRANGCPWKANVCSAAAANGHLEVLQWARENRCPWDEDTCTFAAQDGHLEILQWARENNCPWDKWTCTYAAAHGHLDVLQWAREKGCPWTELTCTFAAEAGHLEVLKWAREKGCPWSEDTCANAAEAGRLEVIQWLRENGCPWDSWTCTNAAVDGHVDVLQWALENGCKWDPDSLPFEGGFPQNVIDWMQESEFDAFK